MDYLVLVIAVTLQGTKFLFGSVFATGNVHKPVLKRQVLSVAKSIFYHAMSGLRVAAACTN
jgi:hypothetical protein